MNSLRALVFIMLLIFVAAGCSSSSEPFDRDKSYTLKVLYHNREMFMAQYGEMFMAMYPNVTLHVLSLPQVMGNPALQKAQTLELIQNEQPDILLIPNRQLLTDLINQEQLYEIKGIMLKETENFYHSGVLNALQQYGNDNLYGLSHTFRRKGVFYNPEIFEYTNILPPTSKITWDELLTLAEDFKGKMNETGEAVVGLAIYDYHHEFSSILDMAATEQLGLIGDNGRTLLFNNEDWAGLYKRFMQGILDGYIHVVTSKSDTTMEQLVMSMKFHNGTAALAFGSDGLINSFPEQLPWEVVTEPIHRDYPSLAYGLYVNEIFAINKLSPSIPVSWELLKLINSDRNTINRSYFQLITSSASESWNGVAVDPFYDFDGVLLPPQETAPAGFFEQFGELGMQITEDVIQGTIDIDKAIEMIQIEGEKLLLK